jgi:hypothetical protein
MLAARAARYSDRELYQAMNAHLWALRTERGGSPALDLFGDAVRRSAFPRASREPDTIAFAPMPPEP